MKPVPPAHRLARSLLALATLLVVAVLLLVGWRLGTFGSVSDTIAASWRHATAWAR